MPGGIGKFSSAYQGTGTDTTDSTTAGTTVEPDPQPPIIPKKQIGKSDSGYWSRFKRGVGKGLSVFSTGAALASSMASILGTVGLVDTHTERLISGSAGVAQGASGIAGELFEGKDADLDVLRQSVEGLKAGKKNVELAQGGRDLNEIVAILEQRKLQEMKRRRMGDSKEDDKNKRGSSSLTAFR